MKVAYTKVPFLAEIRDEAIRKPALGQALVRVRACGVCGTDLHIARKAAGDWCHVGHEAVGEVEEVGTGVDWVKPGDNVIVENCTYCGLCESCKNGIVQHCSNPSFYGEQAGAAEYLTITARALYPFDGLSFAHAAIAEPLTVALDVSAVTDIPLNSTVCVMGPGPIGLMCVKLAKLKGAKTVILTGNSHSKARLALGKELGADEIVCADQVSVADYFKDRYPNGIDRVIVTSPPKTVLDAIKITGFGGAIGFIGIDFGGEEVVTVNINDIHFKRLQLRASHAIPNTMFPTAIDLLKRKVIDPGKFVTHVFPLDRTGDALVTAENNKAEVVKVVIEC